MAKDLKSLYRDYFQKSRMFLYPALDIKRGVSVTPIQTYIAWEGRYKKEDQKLILLYHLRNDEEFRLFEKQKLFGNKLFYEFMEVGDDRGVYVFDFSGLKADWNCFLTGRYSKISQDHKRKIQSFFGKNRSHYAYVESYLYPRRFTQLYADMLAGSPKDVPEMLRLLEEVGELCSIPDFEQETLNAQVKHLELNTNKQEP